MVANFSVDIKFNESYYKKLGLTKKAGFDDALDKFEYLGHWSPSGFCIESEYCPIPIQVAPGTSAIDLLPICSKFSDQISQPRFPKAIVYKRFLASFQIVHLAKQTLDFFPLSVNDV